ncbi:hypothetical protein BCU17_22085 [Vibrio splendidus]|uniref:Uncharacterized protein n=1 Tax=Vibrio splendidus TaxID=29497 RepID=A0A2N7F9A5_VIBSP|nr:hypothetical protein [Vibrio splendidus]PMJ63740.1 hypothetical protein BCU17_22085 [Vibrio splendidus]
MKNQYCWEKNYGVCKSGKDDILFGYIEEWMDYRNVGYRLALCTIYLQHEDWVVDTGTRCEKFFDQESALDWARNVLGVAAIRDRKFMLHGSDGLDMNNMVKKLSTDDYNIYDVFIAIANNYGLAYTPVDFIREYLEVIVEVAPHTVDDINMGLNQYFQNIESDAKYSPWFYNVPQEEGKYLLCKLDGSIYGVNVLVEDDQVIVVERSGKSYNLIENNDHENWLWAQDFGQLIKNPEDLQWT